MYYTYVLLSEPRSSQKRGEKDKRFYTGTTNDLKKRLAEHNSGKVRSSASRRPFKLIYYEACLCKEDAFRREKFLKTGKGKCYLHNRLKKNLQIIGYNKLERH